MVFLTGITTRSTLCPSVRSMAVGLCASGTSSVREDKDSDSRSSDFVFWKYQMRLPITIATPIRERYKDFFCIQQRCLKRLLAFEPIHLENFFFGLGFLAAFDLGDGARAEMAFHQSILHGSQPLLHGGCLGDHIDAVVVFREHLLKAADLAFDDLEPADELLFCGSHKRINKYLYSNTP